MIRASTPRDPVGPVDDASTGSRLRRGVDGEILEGRAGFVGESSEDGVLETGGGARWDAAEGVRVGERAGGGSQDRRSITMAGWSGTRGVAARAQGAGYLPVPLVDGRRNRQEKLGRPKPGRRGNGAGCRDDVDRK